MKRSNIRLEKISYENVDAVIRLRVAKEQREYVADNDWSLIDAYFPWPRGRRLRPSPFTTGRRRWALP